MSIKDDINQSCQYINFKMFRKLCIWFLSVGAAMRLPSDDMALIIFSIYKYLLSKRGKQLKAENFQLLLLSYLYKMGPARPSTNNKYLSYIKSLCVDAYTTTEIYEFSKRIKIYLLEFPEYDTSENYGNFILFFLYGKENYKDFDLNKDYYETQEIQEIVDEMKDEEDILRIIENVSEINNKFLVEYPSDSIVPDPRMLETFYTNFNTKEPELFKKMCDDFGKYNQKDISDTDSAKISLLNKSSEIQQYFGDRDVVVKVIKVDDIKNCVGNNIIINSKAENPFKIFSAFFCKGEDTVISEFFSGIFVSSLNSVNFIDTYAYKDCTPRKEQFIFMEKIDGDFNDLMSDIFMLIKMAQEAGDLKKEQRLYKYFDVLLIQVLHALWCMHKQKMNHNDLHQGNIFYIEVDENTTIRNTSFGTPDNKDRKFIEWWYKNERDLDDSRPHFSRIKDMVDNEKEEEFERLINDNNYLGQLCDTIYFNNNNIRYFRL